MGLKGTLLGGALGWAVGGPIGGLVGGLVGREVAGGSAGGERASAAVALSVLLAAVARSDERASRGEVQYVKEFFVRNFGPDNAADLMRIYKRALGKDLDLAAISAQIRGAMSPAARVELLHVLFGLAHADGPSDPEIATVREAGAQLGIAPEEIRAVEALFRTDTDQAYEVLGARRDDPPDEVKRKYRDLAMKYHPDRVAHLGEEFRLLAEEKFRAIREAYEAIEKSRAV
jgi:DnaJ like chaperone protein